MSDLYPINFQTSFTVYYEDTDAGGVMYHPNFLKFFDRCRTDWLRSHGVEMHKLHQQGMDLLVAGIEIKYHKPVMLDDHVQVVLRSCKLGKASMLLNQEMLAGDQSLLCSATIRMACVGKSLKPVALPDGVLQAVRSS